MERHELLELMLALKLTGMRAAFDEIVAAGIKRQHSVQDIIGDLLKAEIAEKQARSVREAAEAVHPLRSSMPAAEPGSDPAAG